MRRTITLASLSHLPIQAHTTFCPDLLAKSRDVLVKANLRLDLATGEVRSNIRGLISRPSSLSDYTPAESEAEILQDYFAPWITNGASRLKAGFSAH